MTTVGVIIPTLDSARTQRSRLKSLRAQSHSFQVLVADNDLADSTASISSPLADRVIVSRPERFAQRISEASVLTTALAGLVDSDMILAPQAAAEVVSAVESGADVATVPEGTVGAGYPTWVRSFERSFCLGDDDVETAPLFTRSMFVRLGGFDEQLDAAEDWGLGIRSREVAGVARTTAMIEHHEGRVTLLGACAAELRRGPSR